MLTHNLQPSFSGGEVSPHLQARVDANMYNSWLQKACNFYVHPQGGASNRPGTAFVNTAKYEETECRIIPFVISEGEAYVVELGDKYLRIHTPVGTMEKDGAVFELPTPYADYELSQISYAQYGQALFLAHPAYPPKKLEYKPGADFSFSDAAVKGGPFMLVNTDETRKMRMNTEQQKVVSEGVPATVSFLPVSYPVYKVRVFFRGIHFYTPLYYGFDVQDVVNFFNKEFWSIGCVAENRGGVIHITSPAANGGYYNDSELTVHYIRGIEGQPYLTAVYKLSGGIDAGTVIEVGENEYTLESDFDVFKPDQVGGSFALHHKIESQQATGTLSYQGISNTIKTGGDWSLRTTGNWSGEIVLEASADGGTTWQKVKHFTHALQEANLNTVGNLPATAELNYLRVRCLGISGEMGYALQADAFVQEGIVKLKEYMGLRKMKVEVARHVGGADWTHEWAEGSFSDYNGFPSCVFFYQDRLGFAGTKKEPQTLWFSKTGEYDDFGHLRNIEDSDGISINLSGKKLNAIHSVAVSNKLIIFTAGSEWTLTCDGAMSPYNIQVSQEGERGASRVPPILVGNRVLYVQARGSVLRDFFYDYSSASYTGNELTLFARHLFINREIKEICYQQEPENLIWCVLSDGSLLTLTYSSEQDLCAWTRQQTQGEFKSVCVIPSRGYDEVWFVVRRAGKYFIERLLPRRLSAQVEDQVFLDCSISKKSDEPFTELAGLEHLEGQLVCLLADGNPQPPQTVTQAKVTFHRGVRTAHAGLGYESVLQTLPTEIQTPNGTVLDRKRRVVSVMLKLFESCGGAIGTREDKLDELVLRGGEDFNAPVPLKTQNYEKVLPSCHTVVPSVIFKQTLPLPVTVLAFITRIS